MTAALSAAFLLAAGMLAGRPNVWALKHAAPGLFFAGAIVFVFIALLGLFSDRLPFQRKRTAPRIVEWLERPAPLASFFRAPISFVLLPLIGFAGGLAFFAMRMRLFAPPPEGLGDSLLLLEHVPVYTRLFGYLDSFDELLALFLRSRIYLLGADLFELNIETSYALFSAALGGVYLLLVLYFLRGRSWSLVLAGLALFAGAPVVQLYAGYVENYTLASLLLTASLFLAGREFEASDDEDRPPASSSVYMLAALASLGVLVHGVIAFVGPALVYFTWRAAAGDVRRFVLLALRAGMVAGAILLPIWVYFLFFANSPVDFFESFASSPALYPPRRWFTAEHLVPLLNLLLLAVPGALYLFWLAPWMPGGKKSGDDENGDTRRASASAPEKLRDLIAPRPRDFFFLLASLGFLGHAFIWNPLIGFPADWDLFTFFQAPLHCFVFYRLIFPVLLTRGRLLALCGLLFVSLSTTPFWLARNATSTPASRENLARAHANVTGFLNTIAADELFERIESTTRRKKYVKGLLFVQRSRKYLDQRDEPRAIELRGELNRAWELCRSIMLRDENDFQAGFPEAWAGLTRVNIAIEELKARP